MADYNGWKNKETWLVNLWLGDYFASLQEDGEKITAALIESVTLEFAHDAYGRDSGKTVESGFLLDMLNCALGEIDYRELAAHYADEVAA